MSYSKITPEIFFWKVSFYSKRDCLDGSIFPAVPLLLFQFLYFRTPSAKSFVSSNDSSFAFINGGLFNLTTLFPIAITMWRLTVVPAARVPIIRIFTFLIKPSESRFGWHFFLKIIFPFLPNSFWFCSCWWMF